MVQKQQNRWKESEHLLTRCYDQPLPSRAELQQKLEETEHDILIVGGGATGCGIAMDAASRGKLFFFFEAVLTWSFKLFLCFLSIQV